MQEFTHLLATLSAFLETTRECMLLTGPEISKSRLGFLPLYSVIAQARSMSRSSPVERGGAISGRIRSLIPATRLSLQSRYSA